MRNLALAIFTLFSIISCKNTSTLSSNSERDKAEIISVMKKQEKAWSKHKLEEFMQGYWKSDSLKFYGRNGVTKGWQQTLDNYKKGYPTSNDSGKLSFTIHDISKISSYSYSVMGAFHLERSVGNANGIFMIIFKKINGEWKIIADTSC